MRGEAGITKGSAQAALLRGAGAAVVAMFAYSTAGLVPSLQESYWAPIAAVVVLYPETEATRKASTDRFLGTLIGSLVGWASATYWHQNVFLYGVAILLAVAVCYFLGLDSASRLCAVAVTVITIVPRSAPAYLVAFHRFIEVSYGVACAVAYTVGLDFVRRRWGARHPKRPPP
jgi:uncharacterized membrane protein YgaE (UPF0421/DUF939 family)